ncbi:MAG TPA: thioredoxin domain-containing protein [Terriglobales bacterium]|nr:thioredoxin domain-containing protein [Terriglobales bacterium]
MTDSSHNALARASSSYLRSAMHQPIQWHEFGEEAFAAARAANKPMLLDIGAVWCHWCHVMDRESYDDAEVAAIVNEHYIAVKVDRDERPDIDSRYQAAVAALSGQGGWPLTAFLTPDGKPFYGGTYFPPADAYGRPSFKRVLLSIAAAYRDKHGDVLEQAQMVESAIARAESASAGEGKVSATVIDAILESARKMFDEVNGGFGSAPKFPHPAALDLVMEEYVRTRNKGAGNSSVSDGDDDLRTIFVHTLEKMAHGGVYDQLAGGFHRYSVDERWIVPHFEKMCYDNSELLKNYVHAYQATGDEFFAGVARDIVRWMDEWLSDRAHGGFYASQDADYSMDDDGDYFTWTLSETKAALTEDEAAVATLYYDIQEVGDMHHNRAKNVLHIASSARSSVEEIARRLNFPEERAGGLLAAAQKKMYAARLLRPTPYVDKTVYAGWNAMCVSAYLEAAKVLDLAAARHFALRSLDRLLSEGWDGGSNSTAAGEGARFTLKHVIAYSEASPDSRAARREISGVLDDYAFAVIACLDAYEATADLSYFRFARAIADAMVAGFFDPVAGGFFDTRGGADRTAEERNALGILATRRKPFQDSPTPAGNSAAAIALLRLHGYAHSASHHDASDHDHDVSYREQAERTLEVYAGVAGQHGIFAATYGLAVVRFIQPHTQVVVVGNDEVAAELYRAAARPLGLSRAVVRLDADKAVAQNLPPALAETIPNLPALDGERSFAVVCSGFACQPPVFDAQELARALGSQTRPAA